MRKKEDIMEDVDACADKTDNKELLITYLVEVMVDLRDAVTNLTTTMAMKPMKIGEVAAYPEPEKDAPTKTVEDVEDALGDLKTLVEIHEFEEHPDTIFVKKKEFLSNSDFRSISDAVKTLGGEWVSKGAESHWRIRK